MMGTTPRPASTRPHGLRAASPRRSSRTYNHLLADPDNGTFTPEVAALLESSLTVRQLGLVIGLLQCIACASASVGSAENAQATLLRKWALSRCLAKAAADSPAGDDAAKTAAAYLEQGTVGIEVYEKLEALVSGYLEREYTGSVKSNYNTMKCLDLFDSDELDRLVRDSIR